MNGYWFCNHCDDVRFFRPPTGRFDTKTGAICPICLKPAMDWKTNPSDTKRPSDQDAAKMFAEMRANL